MFDQIGIRGCMYCIFTLVCDYSFCIQEAFSRPSIWNKIFWITNILIGQKKLIFFIISSVKVKGYWTRSFPEQNTQVAMIQISFQIKDEHNSGFLLECLSTIPGFMGKHVHSSLYADRRSDSIRSEYMK